ncbi:MAG: hypothetical protein MJ252_03290 [archaeon]|nr:hypothetical protein [archaeon]
MLCDKSKGVCDITYRMIQCEVPGGVGAKIKEGSNPWWAAFYIVGGNLGIKEVKIALNGKEYPLQREEWNYWVFSYGIELKGSFEIKVVGLSGKEVSIPVGKFIAGETYSSNKLFAVPEMTVDPKTLKVTNQGDDPSEAPIPPQPEEPEEPTQPAPGPDPSGSTCYTVEANIYQK